MARRFLTEPYNSVMTEWRPIVGFEEQYEISEDGVRSLRTGKMLSLSGPRYLTVTLSKNGWNTARTFHTLLARAFLGPRPDGMFVLHRDDNKNNNTLVNLYYGTPAENGRDAVRNGKHRQTQKTHCPRNHKLEEPNLVRHKNQRKCRSCRDALNILRTQPYLDFVVVADACYREIVDEIPNPCRRTISQAHRERAKSGTHQMTTRTHCPRGHLLAEPNLEPCMTKKGYRACISCRRARNFLQTHRGDLEEVADGFYEQLGMGEPWR